MRAHSRLRVRITVVVVAGALLVGAGVTLLLTNTVALRRGTESASRTDVYLVRVVDLDRVVVDTETGLRGEIITGRRLFLQPLFRARAQLPGAISGLMQAGRADHTDVRQSAALVAAVRSYMTGYVQRVLGLAAHDLAAARSFPVTLQGKRLVDGIRASAAALERSLSNSQVSRQRSARDTANRSIDDAVAVLVLLTLLTFAVGGYLGRLVVGRERAHRESQETTRTLQESILPAEIRAIPGCEAATRFLPGEGPVSGDFYDVVELSPAEWALMIGDVCGKGAGAAATTAMARWTLRSSFVTGATPSQALRFLNEIVLDQGPESRFITAACLKLTLETESVLAEIACAGHPPPIFVPRDGTPHPVSTKGDLLGVLPSVRLQTAEIRLAPGDALVLYTDGVTDQGPELRLAPEQALRDRKPGADADQLAEILMDLARRPAGPHPDDIAILVLRFLGQGVKPEPTALAPAARGEPA